MAFEPRPRKLPNVGRVVAHNKNVTTIECASGSIYKIKIPGGRLAAPHFALISKAVPGEKDVIYEDDRVQTFTESGEPVWLTDEDGNLLYDDDGMQIPVMENAKRMIVSPIVMERAMESYVEWASKILPFIIVEGDSYDDMPGEDQFGIFMALISKANVDKELFRFVDDIDERREGDGGVEDIRTEGNASQGIQDGGM